MTYPTQRAARKAARNELGAKAKEGLMFVTFVHPDGKWDYEHGSWNEIKKRLLKQLSQG